jgi:hypothetical protein
MIFVRFTHSNIFRRNSEYESLNPGLSRKSAKNVMNSKSMNGSAPEWTLCRLTCFRPNPIERIWDYRGGFYCFRFNRFLRQTESILHYPWKSDYVLFDYLLFSSFEPCHLEISIRFGTRNSEYNWPEAELMTFLRIPQLPNTFSAVPFSQKAELLVSSMNKSHIDVPQR